MFQSVFRNYRLKNYNIHLIAAVMALTFIGILIIGSANPVFQSRQIIGMILGLIVMLVFSLVDYDFLLEFTPIYYVLTCGILIAVLIFGDSAYGAQRWIDFGFIRFQPSEIAKIFLVLFFARYLTRYEEEINVPRRLLYILILAAIPLALIVKEPDLSTTVVTFLIIATMLFIAGLDSKIVKWFFCISIPAVIILLILIYNGMSPLQEYQVLRILAWMKPNDYPGSSYQQQNSIMAIGSGQLFGKGLNNTNVDSVKNGNYISEPQTDFIFAVAGEDLGFVGCAVIVILLFIIVLQCFKTAQRAKDLSGKLICAGIGSLVGYQSFVNICVVTGLMPNTGLTLPFVSYGLTSLVTLYLGIGIVLNVGLQSNSRRGGFHL